MDMLALALTIVQEHGGSAAATTDPVSQGIVAVILASVFVLLARESAHRVLVVVAAFSVI